MNRRQLWCKHHCQGCGCQLNLKRASVRKYLRGLGNYVQVRLTIKGGLKEFFNTILCSLQLRAATNRVNMVSLFWYVSILLFEKVTE